jgi:F-type H+-transporting ATPase subunit delta
MSNNTTIARPYAKAIFEHALAVRALSQWSDILRKLVFVVVDEKASQFITNPAMTIEQQIALLLVPFSQIPQKAEVENFVKLLAKNKRFTLLPDIYVLFELLCAEQEKKLLVDVFSFTELSTTQQQQLSASLSQRLQRQVTLKVTVDKSLLGGAIIQAGDIVIDGSVRGKLTKLSTDIAA